MVYCPICAVPVSDFAASGRAEGVCPKCRYRYGAVTGRVAQSYSQEVPLRRGTAHTGGRHKRAYEFRIDRPDGGKEIVEFEIPGGEDRISVREGDSITVVYAMKDDAFDCVVSVVNNTTRSAALVARPGRRVREVAAMSAVVIAIVWFFVAAAQFSATLPMALLAAAASGLSSYLAIEGVTSARVKKGASAAVLARRHAGFLEKKVELLALRDEQLDSGRHNAGLRTRLLTLIEKMRSVGDELYTSRIGQAEAAVDLLDQLIELDEASLEQYSKTVTMLEIEHESLSVSESMTDEAEGLIADRLATLDVVIKQNADLRLRLEANEEVQRLLS